MRISVITVCYNAAATIEETILSVLNQTYPNVEYIIIDGGSTDGTVEIIKKYADRIASWVSEPDKGIYDAMNKGIAAATGEYLNFMNAGDSLYDENTISEVVSQLDPASDIVYGDYINILKNSRYRKFARDLVGLSKGMVFCHQSTFIRTLFHKQHPFITTFKSAGDYKFFHDAYFVYNAKFQHVPVVVSMFDATTGMSKDNYWIAYKENLAVWGKSDSIGRRLHALYNRMKYYVKNSLPFWAIKLLGRNK